MTLEGGNFVDPKLPKGFTPYGVHDLGNDLYVTYRGPKNVGGAVAEFINDGTFVKQIASDTKKSGHLQSPWGMAQAPAGFGKFSNDLLVGNFSTGQIDAYNASGRFKGPLADSNGNRSQSPGSGLSISAPAWGLPGRRSPCSSPQGPTMGKSGSPAPAQSSPPGSTARSRTSPRPSDPFVSRTGFADPSVLQQIARAGESPAVGRTALRRPGDTTRTPWLDNE